jgi:hypothetical protein
MNTRNIIIGVLVLGGAYWYYNKYMKKPTTATDTTSNDAPKREIAPQPQETNPNIQKTCGGANVRCAPPKTSFMDFDGELEFEKDIY